MVHRNFPLLGRLAIGFLFLWGLSNQAASQHFSQPQATRSEPLKSETFTPQGFTPPTQYKDLEQQLKSGRWMAANAETARLVIAIAQTQNQPVIGRDWLTTPAVDSFPCQAIQQIDRLWNHHSKGRYGFTSQLNLWENRLDYKSLSSDRDRWTAFSKTIQWNEAAPILDENGNYPAPPRTSGALPKPIRSTADFDDQPMHSDYAEFSGSAFLDRARQCTAKK